MFCLGFQTIQSSIPVTVSRRRSEWRSERIRFLLGDAPHFRGRPCVSVALLSTDYQLYPSDTQPVPFLQTGALHALAVHERAVRAVEIVDLQFGGSGAQSTVQA